MASREDERGITIVLVAVVLVVVLGMAALAIDLTALYVSHGQAQRAADAAALAGAKMFVTSGFTSNPSAWTATDLCVTGGPGALAAANQQAEAAAAANRISGQPVTVQFISCPNLTTTPTNPQITVRVQQAGLPSYFARIWGQQSNSVGASATAEAYNPSGSAGALVQASIKPLLIPDCNPSTSTPPCTAPNTPYFTDPTKASTYLGLSFTFVQRGNSTAAPANTYYVLDLSSAQATACPATGALPLNSCSQAGSGGVYDNMACANTNQVSCGDPVTPLSTTTPNTELIQGAQCLVHTTATHTLPVATLCADPDSDCFQPPVSAGRPVTIVGGRSNPDPAFRPSGGNSTFISRSDSIVTVPLYSGASDPCPNGLCSGNVTVTGFAQLGIEYVDNATANAKIQARVLNVAACGTGSNPVSGGGVSPVPVRLVGR